MTFFEYKTFENYISKLFLFWNKKASSFKFKMVANFLNWVNSHRANKKSTQAKYLPEKLFTIVAFRGKECWNKCTTPVPVLVCRSYPKPHVRPWMEEACTELRRVLSPDYVRRPTTATEWNEIAEEFHKVWDMPNCIGALDGKHIRMRKPANSGSLWQEIL